VHELQITERILNIVLQHAAGQDINRIVCIHLRIGELSDLEDEWIQHYFDYLSRGTLAENAKLAITRAPIVVRCQDCAGSFTIKRSELGQASCPECGERRLELVSGRGYLIENMEVM
jgi:hydrogenase nickel incorporation protein HypA/HybF